MRRFFLWIAVLCLLAAKPVRAGENLRALSELQAQAGPDAAGAASVSDPAELAPAVADAAADPRERLLDLPDAAAWKTAGTIGMKFDAYHPQGLVKIGSDYFLSTVEVLEKPRDERQPDGSTRRDAGAGVGHLLKFDGAGNLLADTRLGEGSLYHPGGMDYDGSALWVPVSEYRPGSRAIIYRVDPASMRAVEAFRFPDHVGALIRDRDRGTLVGLSWNAETFYTWDLNGVLLSSAPQRGTAAYQDCQFIGAGDALCGGNREDGTGTVDVVDIGAARAVRQVEVERRTFPLVGRRLTQDPFWAEALADRVRLYFMPGSRLHVLDAL